MESIIGVKLIRGCAGGMLLAGITFCGSATAATLKTLHAFCAHAQCTDGANPQSGLVTDGSGALYGVAFDGGKGDAGLVFALVLNGAGYRYQVVYRFCPAPGRCGTTPQSILLADTNGNLYGETGGGPYSDGTVFELIPNADHSKWTHVILHNFCAGGSPCADGKVPNGMLTYRGEASGAPYDGKSPLFGITAAGGVFDGGVAFQINPRDGKRWSYRVSYDFCSRPSCADGEQPDALTADSKGVLFGLTLAGGNANNDGVAFKLLPKTRTETVLYTFCSADNCVDGAEPGNTLAIDAKGNLYGTTYQGGAFDTGTVFKLAPRNGAATESVVHSFCRQSNCGDGAIPIGVGFGPDGMLYGSTEFGGSKCFNPTRCGVVFQLQGKSYTVLYKFCATAGRDCPDGAEPGAPLLFNQAGKAFGVTYLGGKNGQGTVFELTP